LKIVADENIPLVNELFGKFAEIVLLPGRHIQPADVSDTDILLIRSVTNANASLLAGSKVKFVGTATAGTDHVDINWLEKNDITFTSAKGCNAEAVAEYVVCCIASLQQRKLLSTTQLCAGVVGVGQVGTKVVEKLSQLGFTVLQNDPPRAASETQFVSTALSDFTDLDLICLHTPLIKLGLWPSYHLIDEEFLKPLKPGTIILNAGRGEVIDSIAFKKFGKNLIACFDVWEHEPNLDLDLLRSAAIATPHIAGYTLEAKLRGTLMLYEAAQKVFNLPTQPSSDVFFPKLSLETKAQSWQKIVLQCYDPWQDTQTTQQALLNTESPAHEFDSLRKHYKKRHEFASLNLKLLDDVALKEKNLLHALGIKFQAQI
jgi:erythronate-4-phosphate dehydrogenase